MRKLRRLGPDCRGAAAVEMALVTPLLLTILFGSVELGNYFMDEHTLVAGVRDGARWAARQNFSQYNGCTGTAADVPTPGVSGTVNANTKLIVRKGTLNAAAGDLLPNWNDGNTTFTVTMTCITTAGGVTMSGIYGGNSVGTSGVAPAVTVTAHLPYLPVLRSFGWSGVGSSLNASQQAAVAGI